MEEVLVLFNASLVSCLMSDELKASPAGIRLNFAESVETGVCGVGVLEVILIPELKFG
jgi:hypothetical protein